MTTFCLRCWSETGYHPECPRRVLAQFVVGGVSLCPDHARPVNIPEQRKDNGE